MDDFLLNLEKSSKVLPKSYKGINEVTPSPFTYPCLLLSRTSDSLSAPNFPSPHPYRFLHLLPWSKQHCIRKPSPSSLPVAHLLPACLFLSLHSRLKTQLFIWVCVFSSHLFIFYLAVFVCLVGQFFGFCYIDIFY